MKNKLDSIAITLLAVLGELHCCLCFVRSSSQIITADRLQKVNSMHQASSSTESASDSTSMRTIKILCLHGKGGNGKTFVTRSLGPLRNLLSNRLKQMNLEHAVSFEWDAITAPYEITPSKVANDNDKGFSWWSMPAGVRSFNAQEYEGYTKSEDLVMNTIYSNGECNYDIVLGHSQGAILTAALLSTHDNLWSGSMRPKGFIFNGVAWPNPFNDPMQSLPKRILHDPLNNSNLPMMLLIMGLADDINPIESAKQVSEIYNNAGFSVSVVEHSGGHSVPYKNDDDSQRALNEVVDWIFNTTQQN